MIAALALACTLTCTIPARYAITPTVCGDDTATHPVRQLLSVLRVEAERMDCCAPESTLAFTLSIVGKEGSRFAFAWPRPYGVWGVRVMVVNRAGVPSWCWSNVKRIDFRPEWRQAAERARVLPPLFELVRAQVEAIERSRGLLR